MVVRTSVAVRGLAANTWLGFGIGFGFGFGFGLGLGLGLGVGVGLGLGFGLGGGIRVRVRLGGEDELEQRREEPQVRHERLQRPTEAAAQRTW